MLFNSYTFIFAFLPATLSVFYLLGSRSSSRALIWLTIVSLTFYAWWRPINVLLIAPSIVINFCLARALIRVKDSKPGLARVLLLSGIAFNVCFLGYFKYWNFFEGTINDAFGTRMVLTHVILPLGISFITFQKIAFLVDAHAGRIESLSLRDYALFVLFFPQLVSGPIVHYREMMPQFRTASAQFNAENVAVGLTLFFFGLFKKVIFADSLAAFVSPIYSHAQLAGGITFVDSWIAAVGFTLQIYFDFSGYTDMALGIARFFGVKLPVNFNSPLRATSIVDFWLRWHVSLTRFLTAYIYNPLVLHLTRRRAAKGLPVFGGRETSIPAFATLLMFPTVLTMFVSGLWHGAGYQYVIWGLLHGGLLTVNHGWRILRLRFWTNAENYLRVMRPVGFVLTFLSVVFAMVMFRAPSVRTSCAMWKAMVGESGISLPVAIFSHLKGLSAVLISLGIRPEFSGGKALTQEVLVISGLLAITFWSPNTLQLLARFEPAIGVTAKTRRQGWELPVVWSPSAAWAVGMAVIAAIGLLALGQLSEFLYWQF
jgi:alginate O-acetyltransferase complex protein AlgI